MQKNDLLKKAYSVYHALKKSERKILAGEEHWKTDLQFVKWDWRPGVGLYGIWNLYQITEDPEILEYMEGWLERRIEEGQPLEKTINSVCPMLTLIHIYEKTKNPKYYARILEWTDWIMKELPRTKEEGFSHYCGEKTPNIEQLWDDTLFMTVLFLAKAGKVLNRKDYIEEAFRQFIVHAKNLTDSKTGLWYHVFQMDERTAFAKALWGRGNSWVTSSIPEFLEITGIKGIHKNLLEEILQTQIEALLKYQDPSGLWHTLIDHEESYLETTGTAGFVFGMMKAKRLGYVNLDVCEAVEKGFEAIFNQIDEMGYLRGASDGTALGLNLDFYKNIPFNTRAYAEGLSLLLLTEGIKNLKNKGE